MMVFAHGGHQLLASTHVACKYRSFSQSMSRSTCHFPMSDIALISQFEPSVWGNFYHTNGSTCEMWLKKI